MAWMKIILTKDRLGAGDLLQIEDAFTKVFVKAGGPAKAAMFALYPNAASEEDDVTLYFSPHAVDLAAGLIAGNGGVQCAPPPRGRYTLLVGRREALRLVKP